MVKWGMAVAQAAVVKPQIQLRSCRVVWAWLMLLKQLGEKLQSHKVMTTMMMAAQGMEIPMLIAQASREALLADPVGAHGVGRLWVRRKRMDLNSVDTFVQMMRKSRRRCMINL